ncbi:MAG: flagellar basal body rod C-terminal domain-containing protein [Candidatus Sericytochromatia bacterium]
MSNIDVNPFALMFSMKTVNKWTDTVNSNLNGATKNGFKSMDLYFNGGLQTATYRPSTNLRMGINAAENSINVDHTTISFRQGDLVSSTLKTHVAVQGEGFFVVSTSATGNTFAAGQITNPNASILYTRNGEFHVDDQNRIRTQEGLFVLNTDGSVATSHPSDGESIRSLDSTITAANQRLAIATFPDKQALVFSRVYGSGYFDIGGYAIPTVQDFDSNAINVSTTVYSGKLEASNVNTAKQIAELSASEKLFEALTKQFLVYLNNVDTALNLIR